MNILDCLKSKNFKGIFEICNKHDFSDHVYLSLDSAICKNKFFYNSSFTEKVLEELIFNHRFSNLLLLRLLQDYLYCRKKNKIKNLIKKITRYYSECLSWRNLTLLTIMAYFLKMKESEKLIDILVKQSPDQFSEFWAHFINAKKYKAKSRYKTSFLTIFLKLIKNNMTFESFVCRMSNKIEVNDEAGYFALIFYFGLASIICHRYDLASAHFKLAGCKQNTYAPEYELSIFITNIIEDENFKNVNVMMRKHNKM